jgi:hypothetical protein
MFSHSRLMTWWVKDFSQTVLLAVRNMFHDFRVIWVLVLSSFSKSPLFDVPSPASGSMCPVLLANSYISSALIVYPLCFQMLSCSTTFLYHCNCTVHLTDIYKDHFFRSVPQHVHRLEGLTQQPISISLLHQGSSGLSVHVLSFLSKIHLAAQRHVP